MGPVLEVPELPKLTSSSQGRTPWKDKEPALRAVVSPDVGAGLGAADTEAPACGSYKNSCSGGSTSCDSAGQAGDADTLSVPRALSFYRRKCLELAAQVHRRDTEVVQLRRALSDARAANEASGPRAWSRQ